jgi:hypothetical protein
MKEWEHIIRGNEAFQVELEAHETTKFWEALERSEKEKVPLSCSRILMIPFPSSDSRILLSH